MESFAVWSGLVLAAAGAVSLLKPLGFLGIRSRRRGAALLGAGGLLAVGTLALPSPPHRSEGEPTRIDEFLPVYEFNEVHALRVKAPPDRAFRALREVTPDEIRFLRLLTGIRSLSPARLFGRGRASGGRPTPMLESVLRSGFVLLAEEPDRELVLGTIGQFWRLRGGERSGVEDPGGFLAFERPGFAKAVMDFRVQEEGGGWSRVTTETRIRATDASTRRAFAAYWRVIYPGSALLRRTWLQAVQRRAEAPPVSRPTALPGRAPGG